MFSLASIKEFQLEITSYCNAACPQCPRNINGGKVNPYLPLEHLPRDVIDQAFTTKICSNLSQIFFCGSYGDAIMHPEFLDILRDFRKKSPTLWLYLHTNGGAHTPEFWTEMARIIGPYGKVDFNIDGLDDTNHLYRKNVSFDRVINNASAFIAAGGKADWIYIVFEHNQHQIDAAKSIASFMGFGDIKFRSTGRFFDHCSAEEISEWPVTNRNGEHEYTIKPTTLNEFQNKSIKFLPSLKRQYKNLDTYFDQVDIQCDSAVGKKVVITAQGTVLPCNFFEHNLYDARFHDSSVLPGQNKLSNTKDGQNQVREFLNRYGLDSLSIHRNSLESVFESPMWGDLQQSFNKTLANGRLFECALTCGKGFKKVWDQLNDSKKVLITGGNRGLGLELATHYRATSVSRSSSGIDITNEADLDKIAAMSLDFDVFINNAFDGPPHEAWANFAQTNLLHKVFFLWKAHNKKGLIVNIGSNGSKSIENLEHAFNTYKTSKAALEHASKQCSKSFKDGIVQFKTSLLTLDRLDTPLSRSRDNWTGNGVSCADVAKAIDFIWAAGPNTVVDELALSVNLNFTK